MGKVRHFKAGQGPWELWKGAAGTRIARLVGSKLSKTMGAGILEMGPNKLSSTIDYDEFIVVLSGQFRSQNDGKTYECGPGDVLWIPANTSFTLETDSQVTLFYVRYPMDPSQPGQG